MNKYVPSFTERRNIDMNLFGYLKARYAFLKLKWGGDYNVRLSSNIIKICHFSPQRCQKFLKATGKSGRNVSKLYQS